MRRKYGDCIRADGDCTVCSLVSYGRDCRNKPITNLEWARRREHMSLDELSARSGVNKRQIQRIEQGEGKMGNVTRTKPPHHRGGFFVSPPGGSGSGIQWVTTS